jgi:hypothetical protein
MPEISERKRDRDMILAPTRWPHMWLPLKKRGGVIGTLMSATSDPDSMFRVIENMTIYGLPIGEPVDRIYEGVDALLADGWVVD